MDMRLKIEQLVDELNKLAYEYYTLDDPSLSDKEYDQKYDELVILEEDTGILLPYSPTQRVGDRILSEFTKYTHKSRLWSLGKAQTLGEVIDWHNKNEKAIREFNAINEEKLPPLKYVLTKKFDGLTVNCTYDENGVLTKGATRGNGKIGEDITAQVKTIKTIPLKIKTNDVFEIHGEAIMTKGAFEKYNNEAKVPLKNLRNGAAGALRNLNVKETAKRNLSAFFYDVGYKEGEQFKSYQEMLQFIKDNGFLMDDYVKICSTITEIESEIEYINDVRDDLNYEIDGIVIAIDDMRTRELIGYTVKFPKWALAYKFEAKEVTTKLLDVEWNVGRSGRVTPTAILEAVDIGGVTVKRATLNNMDDINRKGVKLGSNVIVRRSNDVIPEILGVVSKIDEEQDIIPPERCPDCGSHIFQNGVHFYCENTLSCKPQLVKSIVHFGSREAMNIAGFSEKTAGQLFESLQIKSISDLYRIRKEELLELERFGEKKAENLLEAIEKSKNPDLPSFVYSLGIPNVGKKTAIDLVASFKSLENLMEAKYEDLLDINDVGDIVSKNIVDFFGEEKMKIIIRELLELGVTPHYEEAVVIENVFNEKTVVVTGSLQSFSRKEIKDKLMTLGSKVSSSVSKKTDYVIVGKEPGSKYDKAVDLGVKIISEEEFIEMIK
ncbi:NAD-dependent DNA ligase LigA [Clostridium sp. DL1XJH146]